MKIQMTDLKAGYSAIRNEVEASVKKILEKTNFILGEEVEIFEKEFAAYCGAKYAVGVASGTDALKIALIAAGIQKGDEVITTPATFIATTEAITQSGATPVFADVELETYNIDPDEIEKKITPETKAILPVHLYGHPADMDKILKIAKKYNLKVIEDCAQSFTAKYKSSDSRWCLTGGIGVAGCFSFFPAKNLGACGDGGMIITDDETIHKNAKALRNHGSQVRYHHELDGFNSRLDTIQAAILSIKLKHIDNWTQMRNEVARKYNESLKDVTVVPVTKENCEHSFNYYTIRFAERETRDKVQKSLTENGVACQIYYPVPLHLQKVYEYLGYRKGDFPMTEKISDETLSLPMYPELSDEQIRFIVRIIRNCIDKTIKM